MCCWLWNGWGLGDCGVQCVVQLNMARDRQHSKQYTIGLFLPFSFLSSLLPFKESALPSRPPVHYSTQCNHELPWRTAMQQKCCSERASADSIIYFIRVFICSRLEFIVTGVAIFFTNCYSFFTRVLQWQLIELYPSIRNPIDNHRLESLCPRLYPHRAAQLQPKKSLLEAVYMIGKQ